MTNTAYDLLLVIHPETYVSNDPGAVGPAAEAFESGDVLDAAHAALLREASGRAKRCAAILDEIDIDEIVDEHDEIVDGSEIVAGLPAEGWTVRCANPGRVAEVAVDLVCELGARRVLLAGYARHDCVARTAGALRDAGVTVSLDEPTTLPTMDIGPWLALSGQIPPSGDSNLQAYG